MTSFNGELYAGGWFTSAGGITSNYIAKWNGSTWTSLGQGVGRHVNALAVFTDKPTVNKLVNKNNKYNLVFSNWTITFGQLNTK